jgi:hypothetical protein
MTDEYAILDRDSGTNESVARNLAIASDESARLDLDKRSDLRLFSDLAPVEVDKIGLVDNHTRFQNHVVGDHVGSSEPFD